MRVRPLPPRISRLFARRLVTVADSPDHSRHCCALDRRYGPNRAQFEHGDPPFTRVRPTALPAAYAPFAANLPIVAPTIPPTAPPTVPPAVPPTDCPVAPATALAARSAPHATRVAEFRTRSFRLARSLSRFVRYTSARRQALRAAPSSPAHGFCCAKSVNGLVSSATTRRLGSR